MAHWFDIGVNLTDARLDVNAVLEGAAQADVLGMSVTGTDIPGSHNALRLCQAHADYLLCTAGVHPHYAKDVPADWLQQLRALAAFPEVRAIGECGLDFNRNFSPPDTQLMVFEQQLQLAAELQLPVFLHERDAFEAQVTLLQQYRDQLTGGVAHCFTGNKEQMHRYLEMDLFIGITGWVCDPKRGQVLRDAVAELPLSRILLETDAPYLLPKTLKVKSRNNAPQYLPHIAEQVAMLMQVDVAELKQASWQNALALFKGRPGAV